MPAVRWDLHVEQGATYATSWQWKTASGAVVDVSGYVPQLTMRCGALLVTIVPGDVVGLPEGADDGTSLTVGADSGGPLVRLRLGSYATAELEQNGRYDLELTNVGDPTDVVRLSHGDVVVDRQVT
jgi:hypothetical protein